MYYKKADREFKDKLMEIVEQLPLPKDFGDWLAKYPFKDKFYMFFEIEGKGKNKQYLGYCQHCKNEKILLKDVKAGKLGKCPNCHKTIRYRNKKFSQVREHVEYVSIIQRLPISGFHFVRRNFHVRKLDNYIDYNFNIFELERGYITFYCHDGFKYKQWYRYYNLDWAFGIYRSNYFEIAQDCWTYYKNLDELYLGEYEYSKIKSYAKRKQFCLVRYLNTYKKFHGLEWLVELKMDKLVEDLLSDHYIHNLNLKANRLQDFLGLNGAYFKYALKNNKDLSLKMIKDLQFLQTSKIAPTKDVVLFTRELRETLFRRDYQYAYERVGFKIVYDYCWKNKIDLRDYFDYIFNCEELKYDLHNTAITKPYNFKVAHDQAYLKVQSKKNKQLDSAVKKILKTYQSLTFEKDDYCIVVPKLADDIRQEGIDNKNCVGGYVCRVKDGTSIICFVRHSNEKDKSFYTLELNPRTLKVVQCRGYHNEPTPEEDKVQKFVKYWQKNVVMKKLKTA